MTNAENEPPENTSEPSHPPSGHRHQCKPVVTLCKFFTTEVDWLDTLIQRSGSCLPTSAQKLSGIIIGTLVLAWIPFYLSSFLLPAGTIRADSESGTLLGACAKNLWNGLFDPAFLDACVFSPLILGWAHFVLIFFWLFVMGHLIGAHLVSVKDGEIPNGLLKLSAVDYPLILLRQSLNPAALFLLMSFVAAVMVTSLQHSILRIVQYLFGAMTLAYLLIVALNSYRSLQHVAQNKLRCSAILQILILPIASILWLAPIFVLLLVWRMFVLKGYCNIVEDWMWGREIPVTELAVYFSALFLPFTFLFVVQTKLRRILGHNGDHRIAK